MSSQLPSEALAQLLQALGGLARLVAGGTPPADAQLRILLLGAGLESDPAAGQELRRWADLLTMLAQAPTSENRQATVEALMLRGIPEAAAMLAVSVVAGAGKEQAVPQARRLTASVASLDLGTLSPGQGATAEFEVQGGPGQVVAESDQVRVTPQQFGAETTRIRVEVKPLTGGVLWTTLRLVTAGETVEVPVVAQWVESPTPTPPMPDSSQSSWVVATVEVGEAPPTVVIPAGAVVVALDGSGSYRRLEDAVRAASPGATLFLKAGTYRLSEPLSLDKPLTLLGEGMDATRVVCDGEGHVVSYSAEGVFRAEGIDFVHEGSRWANVVVADRGRVELDRCRFSGGVWDEANQRGGDGLWLHGTVRGQVANCQATGNRLMGIRVSDQAQPTLEGNTCQGNKSCGIAYFGSASGVARRNTCSGNEGNGIVVREQAQPTLEGNICQGNKCPGIAYVGSAAGIASRNTCSGNEQHGIYVDEQAQPTLEGNTCQGNKSCGIAYFGSASGIARRNTCSGNEHHGIYVGEQAQPTLEGNTCHFNKVDGISYRDNAGGTARGNECTGNGEDGIYVASTARPTLRDNRCRGNKGKEVNDMRG